METLRKYQKEMLEIRMMKPRPDRLRGEAEKPQNCSAERRGGSLQKTPLCGRKSRGGERDKEQREPQKP